MAEEKVIEIRVDATQADKSLNKFGGTLEDVYGEGVQPLNFAIGELEDRLYEMAAAGQQGTAEFADMAKEVAQMKKVIIDTDSAVDGLAEGVGTNLGGAIQGVAGGFALAQGVMGAFGANSAALEETLLKVQSAMAIADGIQSIREGIRAFKALKVAAMSNVVVQKVLNVVMSLNPIGLIIAAVVALGAAIYALWGPIKQLLQFLGIMEDDTISAAEANEKLTKSYDKQVEAMERASKTMEEMHRHRMKLLELQGATLEELHAEELRQNEEAREARFARAEAERKMIKDSQKIYKQSLQEEDWETAKSAREQVETSRKKYRELEQEELRYQNEKKEIEIRFQNDKKARDQEEIDDEKAKNKERLDNYKKYLADRLSAKREIEDLELDLIDDADRQKLEKRRTDFERELEDLKSNTQRSQKEKGEIELLLTEQYNRDRANLIKGIEEKLEEELLPMREIVEQRKDEIRETSFQKDFEASQKKKKLSEEELADSVEVANAKLQLNSDMLGAVNDLVQAFAKDDERSARRAFNINKAVGIAQAVISTAQAVIGQLAVPQDALTGANFVKAGIVAATGAAQIATIARTQFQGAGGGGSAPSVGSVPTASAASPTFNVVGNTGVNQLAQSLGQQGQQPIETYVVAGNVTTAQSLERNKIENASL
jgi:hypothetical protein